MSETQGDAFWPAITYCCRVDSGLSVIEKSHTLVGEIESVCEGTNTQTVLEPEIWCQPDPLRADVFDLLHVGEDILQCRNVFKELWLAVNVDTIGVRYDVWHPCFRSRSDQLAMDVWRSCQRQCDDQEVLTRQGRNEHAFVVVIDLRHFDALRDFDLASDTSYSCEIVLSSLENMLRKDFAQLSGGLRACQSPTLSNGIIMGWVLTPTSATFLTLFSKAGSASRE